MRSYLLLRHEDCNSLIVKLWTASTAYHLQNGAPVVLPVARHIPFLVHPAPGALQDHQVGRQIYALGQGRCRAKHLQRFCHHENAHQADEVRLVSNLTTLLLSEGRGAALQSPLAALATGSQEEECTAAGEVKYHAQGRALLVSPLWLCQGKASRQ